MHSQTLNWTRSAIFIALGILMPVLFHAAGLGPIFLPMFWPLVIAPFFIGLPHALCVGLFTPVLSMLITGMPPIPILYIMMAELAFMCAILNILYYKTPLGFLPIVGAGLFISRVFLYGIIVIFGKLMGLSGHQLSIVFILRSFPGILLIFILIPIFLIRVKKESLFWRKELNVSRP